MNQNSKKPRKSLVRIPAYRRAFEILDKALSENTRSNHNDNKKIDWLRFELFGCIAE
jgi:hypothetical protein